MKKRTITNAIAGGAAAVLLALTGVSTANAAVEYPAGGEWHYGVIEPASIRYVYSHYLHPSKTHRSSVQTTSGSVYRSTNQPGGKWAKIDHSTGWANNKAYYYVY